MRSVVSLHMEGEVVGSGEGSITQRTLERLLTSVLAEMPRELIAPGKLPRAAVPLADVRFLARVRAHVRLEMRTLRVFFIASWLLANVHGESSISGYPPPSSLDYPSLPLLHRLMIVLIRRRAGRVVCDIILEQLLLGLTDLKVRDGDGRGGGGGRATVDRRCDRIID